MPPVQRDQAALGGDRGVEDGDLAPRCEIMDVEIGHRSPASARNRARMIS